ncbi:hypothetical protein NC653_026678 [Populus alba x Populus x berolinensis]|uniref:Uncharacterized protein n=1 Tax=Populus alba x Populus x berolinensis TaxID=444605 RepID=A0AAD6MEC6_9ROSI|nr:hypothetical protein NC653_026678 [Populus alba x Populus x berolinensis]
MEWGFIYVRGLSHFSAVAQHHLIGTLLGFLEFLKELLMNLSRVSKATRTLQPHSDYLSAPKFSYPITLIVSLAQNAKNPIGMDVIGGKGIKIPSRPKAMAVAPTLVVSTIVPDCILCRHRHRCKSLQGCQASAHMKLTGLSRRYT